MAGSIYNVKCGTGKGSGVFYTFGDGMRIVSPEFALKEELVDVPFIAGATDVADGTLAPGSLVVAGPMYAANGPTLDAALDTLRSTLMSQTPVFYVWNDWVSGTKRYYKVYKARSVKWAYTYGFAGRHADVEVVFSVLSPEFGT